MKKIFYASSFEQSVRSNGKKALISLSFKPSFGFLKGIFIIKKASIKIVKLKIINLWTSVLVNVLFVNVSIYSTVSNMLE